MALTSLVYASCRIPEVAQAKTPSGPSSTAAARSSLPAALRENVNASPDNLLPKGLTSLRRNSGLAFIPSFLQKRVSSTAPYFRKKDIDIELSIATTHVITKIRGGSSDSEDESEEYDSDEESSDDEYESEEYDTDSDTEEEEEYDSESEEEEEETAVTTKTSSLKSSILSKSQNDSDSEDELVEYEDMLTPPAMQQFAISIGVMMLSNRIDILNAKAVRIARLAFVAYLVTVQLFLLYVTFRAKSMDDRTSITISNPLA
eukprot:CAMPEP_0196153606 /NCGR_PEP_ID=MMETSP0910-20130528/37476_1 /TAXON_ID=49265 /ORGANISM="Thalassiosira rotula, Strain GSO102" /LENGTH=259 /DNA_ID=CAMNT_0041417457 /DNA_START=1 /DNA_END=777 /DNA_ORIENTATION=+